MPHIPIGHELMDLIDKIEKQGYSNSKNKNELEFLLSYDILQWIESFDLGDDIKDIDIRIRYKPKVHKTFYTIPSATQPPIPGYK